MKDTLALVGAVLCTIIMVMSLAFIASGEPVLPFARAIAVSLFGLVFCTLVLDDDE